MRAISNRRARACVADQISKEYSVDGEQREIRAKLDQNGGQQKTKKDVAAKPNTELL